MRVVHGAGAADAHDAWLSVRVGHVVAGFRCGLATGQRQLMLMTLAFCAGYPRGSGS